MESFINALNDLIWSQWLVYLCLAAGAFFSLYTRFLQFRHLPEMWRLIFVKKSGDVGISSFQALAVAIAGRVGMGNIAGVAAAIGFGGPGAVFWMWVVALLGASTAYVEATFGQIYKQIDTVTGGYRGGPAFYFERCMGGTGWKIFATLFAVATIIGVGVCLPGVQSKGIVTGLASVLGEGHRVHTPFGDAGSHVLFALAVILTLLGIIIFGGIKRIANFAQFAVPFMAFGYIILALIIVFINFERIPEVIGQIVGDALTPMAGFGAVIGWGVKRGVYSNEAGQGTQPHAAAAAEVEHPAQQGLVQAFSVYVDTIFVCSATAFMILMTGMFNVQDPQIQGGFLISNLPAATDISSPSFTQAAMVSVFGGAGEAFVALAIFFFAFTTILAYYYMVETNVAYLTARIGLEAPALFVAKVVLMASVAIGAVNSSGPVWALGDIGVGLMAWMNIVGIIALFFLAGRPTMKCLADYERQKKEGVKNYSFDPKSLGISNADFWEERLAANRGDTERPG